MSTPTTQNTGQEEATTENTGQEKISRKDAKEELITGAKPQQNFWHTLLNSLVFQADDIQKFLVDSNFATEEEATGGIANNKLMTPLRVKNAIDALENALKGGVDTDGDTLAKLRTLIQAIQDWKQTLTNEDTDTIINTIHDMKEAFKGIPEGAGKVLELLNQKINTSDIVDSLTSTASNRPLSAYQGYLLNNKKITVHRHDYDTVPPDNLGKFGDIAIRVIHSNANNYFYYSKVWVRVGISRANKWVELAAQRNVPRIYQWSPNTAPSDNLGKHGDIAIRVMHSNANNYFYYSKVWVRVGISRANKWVELAAQRNVPRIYNWSPSTPPPDSLGKFGDMAISSWYTHSWKSFYRSSKIWIKVSSTSFTNRWIQLAFKG